MLFLNFISCLLAACSCLQHRTDVEWGRVYIPQWTRRHALIFVYRTIRTTPQQAIELLASRIATTRLKTIPPYVKVSSFVTISTSSSAHISLCSVRRERTQQFDLSNFCNCWKMALPVSTAIDSLTAALRSNIIPNQEYLLQGSILDSSVEVLLHRLRGLCDNVDAALETFHDHEMCFSISKMFYFLLYFRKY